MILPLYLQRKGIISIIWGILVILGMIIASFWVHSKNPEAINEDYVLSPPSIPIFRMLTQFAENPETFETEDDFSIDEDSLPTLYEEDKKNADEKADNIQKAQKKFIFGTDHLGRDVFIRVAAASKTYLLPCSLAVVIALIGGSILGIFSGYFVNSGLCSIGKFIQDSIRSIPVFVGIIIVMSATKIDIYIIMISFGILVAPRIGTIVEQQIYSLRQHDFIIAAIEMGIPTSSIIVKHILFYNCLPLIIAQAAFTYAEAVLIETSLGFLGIGALGEDLSWGYMVKSGLYQFIRGNLWISLFPTLAIIINIVSFQALGNGLIKFFDFKSHTIS